jgi:hypothetical protein
MNYHLDHDTCELNDAELDAVAGGGKNEASIVFANAKEHLNGADLWNTFVGCAGVPGAAMPGYTMIPGGGCPA